jgi:hypothetical protein
MPKLAADGLRWCLLIVAAMIDLARCQRVDLFLVCDGRIALLEGIVHAWRHFGRGTVS